MDDGQPIGPLAQAAGGGNPQQGQLFQMMMDSAQKKQGYLQQQQEAYNADLDKYAQMVQNSQQPGANEAQMWGNMAQASARVAPTWGNTGAMIAGIGGAYGDQQAQEMQQNLKNQSDLTKLRQNEVRALEAKDQQVQMMKALGGGNKQVTPEQLRTVYTSARNEAAQIAKDHKWESAEQRGAWIEQYSKRAVDEYRNQYQLNTGASYGAGGDKGAPMPSAPVAKEDLTTKIDQSLDDKLRQLSPDDNATAIRLINRIAANPQTASNDGKTLQGILDRYYPDGKPQAVAQQQNQGKIVAPPMIDKVEEAARKAKAVGEAEPMPTKAMDMQQEQLDVIGLTSSINNQLSGITKDIEDKKLDLGPVSNLLSKGKNWAGYSDQESQKYSDAVSTLEKMRNDSLRLNKGVSTEGDAERAWNELFTNMNDPDVVKNRLKKIVKLNLDATEKKKQNINVLRKNYGKEPLDFSLYESEDLLKKGAATGGSSEKPTTPTDADKEARYQAWKKARGL